MQHNTFVLNFSSFVDCSRYQNYCPAGVSMPTPPTLCIMVYSTELLVLQKAWALPNAFFLLKN